MISGSAKGVGWRSGRENMKACLDWVEDRILMTNWAGASIAGADEAELAAISKAVVMRDGIRRANVTRGYGSIAIGVKEETVAPWWSACVLATGWAILLEDGGMSAVTTATGWAVPRKSSRSCSCIHCSWTCGWQVTHLGWIAAVACCEWKRGRHLWNTLDNIWVAVDCRAVPMKNNCDHGISSVTGYLHLEIFLMLEYSPASRVLFVLTDHRGWCCK